MKKIISLFLTTIIVVYSFTMVAVFASDIKTGELNDNVSWELSNGKLTVYGVGRVEIPQGSYFIPWRKYADEIIQVEIKDGITEIGNAAFAHLENVYDIPIPNSVTSIGENAFTNCTNLLSVKLPNNLKYIGKSAFYGCSNLKSVTIPKSITYMGDGVFADCISLIDVNIENGLKVISPYTFSGCSSLTNINIPSSVLSIEEYAFYSCYSLQNVMFEGQTQIANNAFERCTSLKSNKPSSESFNTTANDRITVTLNNELIYFDVQPIEIEGRVLVPVRAIFEALGATVNWDGEKNEVKSTKGDITIKLYKDDKTMYKNGNPIVLDVPAKVVNDRILVPVRAISEAFGCKVDWDGTKSQVVIISNISNIQSLDYVTMYSLDGTTIQILKSEVEAYKNVGWYTEPVQMLYALDGRSQAFKKSEVPSQLTVGWYEYPVVMMYALDGRTLVINSNEISAYENVGWYYGVPLKMYAPDGRVITIGSNRVEEYKNVGWYTEPVVKMYAVDNGNLKTIIVLKSQVAANKKVGWRTDMPKSKQAIKACDKCSGTSRINCGICGGLGYDLMFDGFIGDDNDGGINFVPSYTFPKYKKITCILCSGSGTKQCDSCRGKGTVSTTVYYY